MDDRRVGALIRALRRRFGWRQEDLGERADVSQGLISLLERGHIEQVSLRTIRVVRAWLRTPTGPLAGLLFVPDTNPGSARLGRVRRMRTRKAS